MKNFFKNLSKDLVVGLIFLIAGFILLSQIMKIKNAESAMIDYFIIGLYMAMAVIIIFTGIFGKAKNTKLDGLFIKPKELLLLAILVLTYYLLTLRISFFYLVLPFTFAVNLLVTEDYSKKNILVSAVFAVVFSIVIFVTCRYGLKILI